MKTNSRFLITTALALAFTFSFSQESLPTPTEKPIVYDTIHRVIADSVTVETLKSSQEFYSSAFKDIQGSYSVFLTKISIIAAFISVIATILGVVANVFLRKAKNYNEKVHKQLEEQQKLLDKLKEEIKKESETNILEFKKELKEQFENDRNKIQENFDTSFRFMSRIYRKLAEDFLNINKENSFNEYFYYMNIFYRCLMQINELNKYDLRRLKHTYKLLNDKGKRTVKQEDKSNICWYTVHMLKFINRCYNDNELGEHFVAAKSIYNDFFNDIISRNDIVNCMKEDEHKDPEIQEVLKFAEDYKSKSEGIK